MLLNNYLFTFFKSMALWTLREINQYKRNQSSYHQNWCLYKKIKRDKNSYLINEIIVIIK